MNLIINAFAFKENYGNSMQLANKGDDAKLSIYMKNIVVSLVSAKKQNPGDEVMLIANAEPNKEYADILKDNGIKITIVSYDEFQMPKEFPWALAFYKLCALKYVVEKTDYERVLLIDSDTISFHSYESLWKESDYGILLYNINHDFAHEHRGIQKQVYKDLYEDEDYNLVHYGGEFIAGTKDRLMKLVDECEEVYNRIKEKEFKVNEEIGDELILSVAAIHLKNKGIPIYEGGAYIFRYWTNQFYLVCTNTIHNPVCIWHLPVEKDRGFLYIYNYYIKKHTFPCPERAAQILGIVEAKRPGGFLSFYTRVLRLLSTK